MKAVFSLLLTFSVMALGDDAPRLGSLDEKALEKLGFSSREYKSGFGIKEITLAEVAGKLGVKTESLQLLVPGSRRWSLVVNHQTLTIHPDFRYGNPERLESAMICSAHVDLPHPPGRKMMTPERRAVFVKRLEAAGFKPMKGTADCYEIQQIKMKILVDRLGFDPAGLQRLSALPPFNDQRDIWLDGFSLRIVSLARNSPTSDHALDDPETMCRAVVVIP